MFNDSSIVLDPMDVRKRNSIRVFFREHWLTVGHIDMHVFSGDAIGEWLWRGAAHALCLRGALAGSWG
jgi:hypothetical protein